MRKSGTNKLIFMVILKTTLMVSMCTSRFPGTGKINAKKREEFQSILNTYLNSFPKFRNNRITRWGTIAIFVQTHPGGVDGKTISD